MVEESARAALGHDPDDVEHLQRVDQPEQQGDRGDRAQQREGDLPEPLPGVAPSSAAAS